MGKWGIYIIETNMKLNNTLWESRGIYIIETNMKLNNTLWESRGIYIISTKFLFILYSARALGTTTQYI